MRLLLVDNYDSFVFNLAQAFGALGADPVVVRNDVGIAALEEVDPDAVVISPGPGGPEDAGISIDAVKRFAGRVPVLGVCLGHQCIGSAFGGRVDRAAVGPVHGKTSEITHDGRSLFEDVPEKFTATRYHSLAIDTATFPHELEITARSEDGVVMGVRHRELVVEAVQFHPESVLCMDGPRLLENFLSLSRGR